MKTINKWLVLIILTFIAFLISPILSVDASPATSYTYTLNAKGRMVRTQDAYLPERTIVELNLKDPQDMFFDEQDILYIADTGNRRIIKYDPNTDTILLEIHDSDFREPTGLFVSGDHLYIADRQAQKIFKYHVDGTLVQVFGTPKTIAFEEKAFDPAKIAVDKAGNMYIQAASLVDGIIQLSDTGEFLGFFTSNRVSLSLIEKIQDWIFTEEQKARFFRREPMIFSNVYIDHEGLVYTTSMNAEGQGVKRHNIAGGNMFDFVFAPNDPVDIYTNKQGIIFVAMVSGQIFVYSPDGDYIFSFGASNFFSGTSDDISGLFNSISSVAVDSQGQVWVLDNKKAFVQSFKPTEYAIKTYEALSLYYEHRDYEASVEVWQEVLRLNQMSVLAHNYIGKSYYALQDYEKAMEHFEIAGNRYDYSQAFWEVRNQRLQKYLGPIFIAIVVLFVIGAIVKVVERYHPFQHHIKSFFSRIKEVKLIEDLLYIFRVMRHPLDSFYEIKKGNKGSLLASIILFFIIFIVYMWYLTGKDFIYQYVAIEDIDFNSVVLGFFGLVFLFIICNYLVTSITDGEGTFKNIFMMAVYSAGPLLISFILVTLLSYVVTYNEAFLLRLIHTVGIGWSAINLFLGVSEVHNYTFINTVKSILITVAFMVIFIIFWIIVIVMWEQLYNFFEAIIREVIRNAKD